MSEVENSLSYTHGQNFVGVVPWEGATRVSTGPSRPYPSGILKPFGHTLCSQGPRRVCDIKVGCLSIQRPRLFSRTWGSPQCPWSRRGRYRQTGSRGGHGVYRWSNRLPEVPPGRSRPDLPLRTGLPPVGAVGGEVRARVGGTVEETFNSRRKHNVSGFPVRGEINFTCRKLISGVLCTSRR